MTNFAFVFPGQGSQTVGMLNDLATRFPLVTALFAEVSDALGYDVWRMVQQDPEGKLNQTEFTQVAMLTADVAVYRVLQQSAAIPAAMMAGHSLGEYAALVCAGAISLPGAALLVAKRGQLMQSTVPLGSGAMAAIVGLSDEQVTLVCAEASTADEQVIPANFNAIGQVVIAGHAAAVEKAILLAEAQDARMARVIPVSVPCHCPLLKEAADLFAEYLAQAEFKIPQVPVISNVDLSIYESAEQIRMLLKEQLYRPVQWVRTIQLMKENGIDWVIECGPGRVLSGLVKRIDKSLQTLSVNDQSSLDMLLKEDAIS
ncbi:MULTISPECIES: ACP S-malonyltransferase [Legionella]|uniref:Malonyl CoA-acyl carrier protein transacylase n=1 Tax=Legionella septentrionalis TaxID=2498109 RepID=A0A3S1CKN1_9GAMM|nr:MULTISPECIES: ACP S-malonyltransferase [Legionella]MCP0914401.1 ACP S-malonyltransferase [Legionella sp. 27cVA30]RUQ81882.1 [acyl-carrier-protein] S-malonyltransferase [Legionella septentrionalis]RUR00252.1 [acyl-carrier-protein] S-malonyltransferase [Legionella septentrionalis]RUR09411.1 [acyl-carrier-protein] S-malonyltransferase [Legionella septentrionalis]RUR17578.1 [acyl-carrier-protein] S-malonyltransferase [Legionella septentrionalis]